nr:MAG TPA: hypothetical protein [Caudoviricetes sp.]
MVSIVIWFVIGLDYFVVGFLTYKTIYMLELTS